MNDSGVNISVSAPTIESLISSVKDPLLARSLAFFLSNSKVDLSLCVIDTDRLHSLILQLLTSIILPTLKGPQKNDLSHHLASNLLSMLLNPSIIRLWSREFWDLFFYEVPIFSLPNTMFTSLTGVVRSLCGDTASERFSEILGKSCHTLPLNLKAVSLVLAILTSLSLGNLIVPQKRT